MCSIAGDHSANYLFYKIQKFVDTAENRSKRVLRFFRVAAKRHLNIIPSERLSLSFLGVAAKRHEATPKHDSDHAVVAFVLGCRCDVTRKHDSDKVLIGTDVLRQPDSSCPLCVSPMNFYPLDPACASFAYCIHVQKLP